MLTADRSAAFTHLPSCQWSKASTLEAKLVPMTFTLGFCAPVVFILLHPQAYRHLRDWLLPAVFVAMACAPSYRRIDSGLGLLLHRPPQLGWMGAAFDAMRTAAGG